jgi:hypothetical protein
MSMNGIGGVAAVIALAAILYAHERHRTAAAPAPVPTRVEIPVPAPAPKPAPRKFARPKRPTVEEKKPVYRKVIKGGKIDGPISCKQVPLIAHQYPPDKVIAVAKQYGLSPSETSQLRLCLN